MKIYVETIKNHFENEELQQVLIGSDSKKVRAKDMHGRLLASANREELSKLYLVALKNMEEKEPAIAQKLQRKYSKQIKKAEKSTPVQETSTALSYGVFPQEKRLLKELDKEDTKHLGEVLNTLKIQSTALDSELTSKSQEKSKQAAKELGYRMHRFPYDDNQVGSEEGIFLNASDIHIPGRKPYIIGGCTANKENVRNLYHMLLKRGVSLMVTTNQAYENGVLAFWTKEGLEGIVTQDGWALEHAGSRILAENPNITCPPSEKTLGGRVLSQEEEKTYTPKIVETKIIARREEKVRELIHLHYEHWQDHHAAPDVALLKVLTDRIYELNMLPFINCRGGVGRSGTVLTICTMKDEVRAQVTEGKHLDEIEVNIPEHIYALRRQRPRLVSHDSQMKQIYTLIHQFYLDLKSDTTQQLDQQ